MQLTIEQAVQQGVASHKEGNLQEAERLYRAILQSQPGHPDANHNLGLIAVSQNKVGDALPFFKAALEANPNIEQFWLSYVDALVKANQLREAKQTAKNARKKGFDVKKLKALLSQSRVQTSSKEPSQEQLRLLLEHYQNGRLAAAEKLTLSITQDFPEHQLAWKVLGAVLKQTGRASESLVASQKSVQIAPEDPEAHNNLGSTFRELGRLTEAEASYGKALVLNPDYAEAHNNLGTTLKELERLDEAVKCYRQSIALNPGYAEAHNNLGTTLQELERLDEAEASFNQAINFNPDLAEAHYNLGTTLQKLGKLKAAEASLKRAIALKPGFSEAYSNLGVTAQQLGNLEEAKDNYTQAIALRPDYAEAYSNLGITFQNLARLDEAETSFKKAIALRPEYWEVHYNLGNTLMERERLEEAQTSYKQTIALKPDFAEAQYKLGLTFKKLGRLQKAIVCLNKAIELNPDFGEAKHILAAFNGKTTPTAPRDYVEGLFDNYANKFETSLVKDLEYKTPKAIAEMTIRDNKFEALGSIIDLGCGTGLLGLEIREFCNLLEGIDISGKMLERAEEKNIYNKLIKQDIIDYLSNENLNFDYFIATDVFVYIGDLFQVFRLIKFRNKTCGKLVFSTEHYDGNGFSLEQSGRYSHSKKYIIGLCEKFGYKLRHFETQTLRKERDDNIIGGLYLLDF